MVILITIIVGVVSYSRHRGSRVCDAIMKAVMKVRVRQLTVLWGALC